MVGVGDGAIGKQWGTWLTTRHLTLPLIAFALQLSNIELGSHSSCPGLPSLRPTLNAVQKPSVLEQNMEKLLKPKWLGLGILAEPALKPW